MELLEHKVLLEKYFEGNTSKKEELKISRFLSSYQGKDKELLEAKAMFSVQSGMKQETVTINFDAIVNQERVADSKPSKLKRFYMASSAVAAVLVAIISLLFVLKTPAEPVVYAYVNGQAITNKAEALQYSQEALKTMSTNLNIGTQNLNYMKQLNKPAALITAQ